MGNVIFRLQYVGQFTHGQLYQELGPQIYQHRLCTHRFFLREGAPRQEKQVLYTDGAGRFEGPSS